MAKDTEFKFGTRSRRDSLDRMAEKLFSKGGVATVTRSRKLLGVKCWWALQTAAVGQIPRSTEHILVIIIIIIITKPTATFPDIFNGLLFRSILWFYAGDGPL